MFSANDFSREASMMWKGTEVPEGAVKLVTGMGDPGDHSFSGIGFRRFGGSDQASLGHQMYFMGRFPAANLQHAGRIRLRVSKNLVSQVQIHRFMCNCFVPATYVSFSMD